MNESRCAVPLEVRRGGCLFGGKRYKLAASPDCPCVRDSSVGAALVAALQRIARPRALRGGTPKKNTHENQLTA